MLDDKFLKVLRLPENKVGRDILVTDIHGMFDSLIASMQEINFDKTKDRLIVAGDLVDRGNNSFDVLNFLEEDWFFSVAGNHDLQYAYINDSEKFNRSIVCLPIDMWWKSDLDKFKVICKLLRENLYSAIEIETKDGLVGIVHAEVPTGLTWNEMTARLKNKDYDLLLQCVWNRQIANIAMSDDFTLEVDNAHIIEDVLHVFHGHSINNVNRFKPYSIGNRFYIDTGSYRMMYKHNYPDAKVLLFDARNPSTPLN